MTRLGAETAASTDEIAAGLSKFSAVADTIGLSFEMATSAVTAIIDQTRESPEVVGTALKTIFSRMEGLKQGETLEDGVDLNKYSEGLAKVGVSIMDASG
jgi:TP901 family phage tail tape measure protein